MVQGLPGTTYCNGPFDVVRKVVKTEGLRGMYRGFGLTALKIINIDFSLYYLTGLFFEKRSLL